MSAYDPTNPKHVAIARRTAKAIADSKAAFLKHAMGLVDGRTFIHDLLDSCHVFNPTLFSKEGAERTAYNCGQHSVGQALLEDIMHVAPDEHIQMMREAYARAIADDTRRSRSDADTDRNDRGPEPEPYVHPAYERPAKVDGGTEGADYSPTDRLEDEGTD